MKNILITGQSGTGKTLLIKKLADIFKEFNPQGFLTLELKEEAIVTGFGVISLSGESKIISHPGLKSKHAVGKFRIDLKGFETFLSNAFTKDRKTGLYFIDEIGKVECQSKKFCRLVIELFSSDQPVIASMADKGSAFIQEIKKRDDIQLVELTVENRDQLIKELTMEIRDLLLE
ncbi:MAG: AAA family ATPase [Nitrospiraceae bacterium]|nr:AAA family ATPase [Nitrospiraceae bacterium]